MKLAEAPRASVPMVPVMVPVPPTAGLVRANAGPEDLGVGDEGRVSRHDVGDCDGLGVAGAGVGDRDRVSDVVAREHRTSPGRLRQR